MQKTAVPDDSGFQSTLSMRRATWVTTTVAARLAISIHALHEESDPANSWPCCATRYFNPRSP